MKRYTYVTLLSVMFLGGMLAMFSGCRKEKSDNGQTSFEATLNNEDSVAVVNLIDKFFGELENGDVYSAVAMLYKINLDDPYDAPLLLDNDEMETLVAQFKALPVYDHKIDYIKFNKSYLNEAKCTAVIQPAQDGQAAATMIYYLKPVSYLGGWVLCLMNTNSGDHTFVDNGDKDSLERHYQETVAR